MTQPVRVLPFLSSNTGLLKTSLGDVVPTVKPFDAAPHCDCEWYFGTGYNSDYGGLFTLIDMVKGGFAAPRNPLSGAAWPTFGARSLTLADYATGAGLLLPIAHPVGSGHTVMMVFERPAMVTGRYPVLLSDAGDVSPVNATGQFLFYDPSGVIYTDTKGVGSASLAQPAGAAAGSNMFLYYSETPDDADADAFGTFIAGIASAAGSINGRNILQSGRPLAAGNRYINNGGYAYGVKLRWVGQTAATKTAAQCLETYAAVKANLAAVGVSVM